MSNLTQEVVQLMIGVFIVFVIANALYTTIDTAVNTFNETLYTAGKTSTGDLVVRGWDIASLGIGLAALFLGVRYIYKRASMK